MADDVDALYATAPAAFVQARNALAKTLKAAGRREEAAQVAALSRPSPAVWAVNQIARHLPALVTRLGVLTAQLQQAPRGASYVELVNAHRDLLRTLRDRGAEILEAAGLRASPEVLATLVQNLRAGMADPAARPLIEGGRLEHDVESEALASGFAAPPDAPAPVVPSPPRPAPERGAAERERTRAESAARAQAEKQRAEAENKRAEAQLRIDRLRVALGQAQKRQTAEEDARAEAAAALGEADRRLVAAREAAARAASELSRAEADLAALGR